MSELDPIALFDSIGIAVLWLDTQLQVRHFTPAVADLLEICAADIGRPLARLGHKFDDGDLLAHAQCVVTTGIVLESEVRSHSGHDYLRRTLPCRTEGDHIAGVIITFIDISERRRRESALEHLISSVSHDLRTPLNTIRLWSRMFASGKIGAKDLLEGASIIARAASTQQQLIDDLVEVASMAQGQPRLELRDVPLSEVVASAVGELQPLAASRRIALDSQIGAPVQRVRIDPHRMQQVVRTLLAHAVRLTPEGGRVCIRLGAAQGHADIEVGESGSDSTIIVRLPLAARQAM